MAVHNILTKPTLFLGLLFLLFAFLASLADAEIHYHDFVVRPLPSFQYIISSYRTGLYELTHTPPFCLAETGSTNASEEAVQNP